MVKFLIAADSYLTDLFSLLEKYYFVILCYPTGRDVYPVHSLTHTKEQFRVSHMHYMTVLHVFGLVKHKNGQDQDMNPLTMW